jgi:RNA polymerase sigma-54 factor
MVNMEFWTTQEERMEQRPAATLIAFASLLALPSIELEQTMRQELAQNPALELSEADICPRCGNLRNDGICYFCLEAERFEMEGEIQHGAEPIADEDFDLFSIVAAPRTLAEEMTELGHAALPKDDHFIADFLIGGLDDKGLLDLLIGDVVRTLGVSPSRVRNVLGVLQRLGPPGVAARDAQECLLLQLERLEVNDKIRPLARSIIEDHIKDLAQGRYVEIAQALGTTPEQVIEARDFIRNHLRPFPILHGEFEAEGTQVVDTPYTTPDVIIRADPNNTDEFTVEVIESRRFGLRISPLYRELAQSLRHGNQDGIGEEDRHHILEHVSRAQQFIGHLRERRNTLARVAQVVVKHQSGYLKNGVRHLTPLTRLQVAEELGLHVSTVSRAVADKYVLLPWQQITPMRVFFEVVRNVQDVLRELVAAEDHPLTDLEIADRLAEQGHPVARRTVAKYRKQLGILPSTLR